MVSLGSGPAGEACPATPVPVRDTSSTPVPNRQPNSSVSPGRAGGRAKGWGSCSGLSCHCGIRSPPGERPLTVTLRSSAPTLNSHTPTGSLSPFSVVSFGASQPAAGPDPSQPSAST